MRDRVGVRWLVSLRWLLVACAAVLVVAVDTLAQDLPALELLGLVSIAGAANAWLSVRARRDPPPGEPVLAMVLLLDTAVLTGMLALSGGAHNPFAALYLFEGMVASLVLRPVLVAGLCGVAGVGYALLFLEPAAAVHDPAQMQ